MKEEPNWGRRSVIAAWALGLPMLAIAVLSYLRPPDPAHPMQLDFLTRSISLPLWLAVFLGVATSALTAAIVHWNYQNRPKTPLAGREIARLRQRVAELEDENSTVTRRVEGLVSSAKRTALAPPPAFTLSSTEQVGDLLIRCNDDIAVKFSYQEAGTSKGVVLSLVNNRLTSIGNFTMRVVNAQSFDLSHKAFREKLSLTSYQDKSVTDIGPSCSSESMWIVRKDKFSDGLLVGNSATHPLMWPPNDNNTEQTWLLSLIVVASLSVNRNSDNGFFSPSIVLTVTWNQQNDRFLFEGKEVLSHDEDT